VFSLLISTGFCLNSCTSGWSGAIRDVQNTEVFENKAKSEIIRQFGLPDSSFTNEDGIEYWRYKSYRHRYFILWGRKKEKILILKFKNNKLSSAYLAEGGELDEVATRGWEYLDLLMKN
jgi:hypothetical protein